MPTDSFIGFIAGGLSCMTSSAILNPMDTTKVRMQTQGELRIQGHDSFRKTFRNLYVNEGIPGLFRGITASMLREASYSSIRMGLYEPVKHFVAPDTSTHEFALWQKILAGFISGGIGSAIANPSDLVKIRFQAHKPSDPKIYKNTFDALYQIAVQEGFKGLYKGVLPTTLRAAVLTSAQLSSYDHSKVTLRGWDIPDGPALHFGASFISGLVTTTATSPVDVIKTRFMNAPIGKYKNPYDCLILLLRTEGPKALFRGWVPNYLRLGPHFIISLPLYEHIRLFLGGKYL